MSRAHEGTVARIVENIRAVGLCGERFWIGDQERVCVQNVPCPDHGTGIQLTPEYLDQLEERLRGRYRVPIRDGAGPLNEEAEWVEDFKPSPINVEAAVVIAALRRLAGIR